MKKLLMLCLLTGCAVNKPHVDAMIGIQDFDDKHQWEDTDGQVATGLQVDMAGKDGIGPEASFIYSKDSSYDNQYINRKTNHSSSTVQEMSLGLRKNWMLDDKWQLFAGGGMSYVQLLSKVNLAYEDNTIASYSDAYTPYAQGGLNYMFDSYSIGLLYRRTFLGEAADAFINSPPSDSNVVMLSLGYSF